MSRLSTASLLIALPLINLTNANATITVPVIADGTNYTLLDEDVTVSGNGEVAIRATNFGQIFDAPAIKNTYQVNGNRAVVVQADNGGEVIIENSILINDGVSSHTGVVMENSKLTITGSDLLSFGDNSAALFNVGGRLIVNKSKINTTMFKSYGVTNDTLSDNNNYVTEVIDSEIITSGEQSFGVQAAGGTTIITNTSLSTSGELARGISVASNNANVILDTVNINTSGNNRADGIVVLGKLTGNNVDVITRGSNSYGITMGASGVLELTNSNIIAEQNPALNFTTQSLHSNAVATFINSRLQGGAVGITSGNAEGTVNIISSEVSANRGMAFHALSSSELTINAKGGSVITGGAVADSTSLLNVNLDSSIWNGSASNVNNLELKNNAVWTFDTDSSIANNLYNSGAVIFSSTPITNSNSTLIVSGDYIGDDGSITFNTVLSDDNSLTDKLYVSGDVEAGNTSVHINNINGQGALTSQGIEIVSVGGQSFGAFTKYGRIVAGVYEYDIVRKGESWYLVSGTLPVPEPTPEPDPIPDPEPESSLNPIPTMRPEIGSYLANNQAANTLFMTRLHDRLGETQYTDVLTGEKKVTSMWIRNTGGHTRFKDGSGQIGTQSNRYVLQLGGDLAQWSTDGLDRWHVGVMGGYANSRSRSESGVTGYTSRGQVDGYSAGLYGTWYANEADKTGTYVDSWVLYNWFDNSVSGQGLVTENYKSRGVTASVEAGYSLKLAESKRDSYWLQPKIQMVWMDVQADDHREANGTEVKDDTGGNLMTRLGLKGYINGHNVLDNNNDRTFQPFVEMNWIHNTRDTGVTMNGVQNEIRGTKNIGELKVGVEGQLTPRLNLWGNVAQQVGNKGYSDTQGMLGIKYVW
ncbi:autotransporter outer membrane beta-barrel domain-containing protein [Citrobacter farmeri]|uniref:autotransporter outer membrane beta-barrel domain-containing protein n=1 Tax=Citrobacter farmeri TaxID=67824 RepID=UPI001899B302|nr:autotransporter outer membrane beta-barrel domain-containing protein [Citrobacter farmeri]MDB2168389.1 autotransporter outer membrane beta-barrel domain-containing protein [Citrobacter farmeri]